MAFIGSQAESSMNENPEQMCVVTQFWGVGASEFVHVRVSWTTLRALL